MILEFEDFLKEKHAEEYIGTDDDMPDAFNDWLGELDGEEYIEFANQYGKQIVGNKKLIDIPGFEGTLKALDELSVRGDIQAERDAEEAEINEQED